MEKKRDFRCKGKNKKNRDCNQLLFRYYLEGNKVNIVVKCPNCNSFNFFTINCNPEIKEIPSKGRKPK